jgi:prepilin-type N-terminal cleavage/methylation domain-containing protein
MQIADCGLRNDAQRIVLFPKPQTPTPKPQSERGFTLIEILVVVVILAMIMGIVYECFAAVMNSTDEARRSADEMRLRRYLIRSLSNNFASTYTDLLYLSESCQFLGVSEDGGEGALDTIDFCSSAPLMGGRPLPGTLKRVHYGVVSASESGLDLDTSGADAGFGDAEPSVVLECSETPVSSTYVSQQGGLSDGGTSELMESESPTWSVPIQSVDFAYFDGEEWLEEWDSISLGRLPWCVRARINFARAEEEDDSGNRFAAAENPDLEITFPIPGGAGVLTDASMWTQALLPSARIAAGGGLENTQLPAGQEGKVPKVPKIPATGGTGGKGSP